MRLSAPIPRMSLTVSFCGAWLCACAYAPVDQNPTLATAKEQPVITTQATSDPGQGTAPVKPQLTAEHALTRLLELIRSSKSIQDLTPEKLTEVFGQELWRDGPDKYGFGEQVTQNWSHGWEVYKNPLEGMQFNFSFTALPPGTFQDMTDICRIDFDQFGAEMEAMGFSKKLDYGEYGRLINHTFDRPGMRVEIYPRGEANDPPEKIAHDCVEMVIIS